MACFVVFLALVLIANTLAAPANGSASNSGHSYASDGSVAAAVVDGATFYGDAFSIGSPGMKSGNDVQSSNPPVSSCGLIKDLISKIVKSVCPNSPKLW